MRSTEQSVCILVKKADKKVDKKERRHEDGQLGKQYPQGGSVYTGRTAKSDGYDQIKYK